MSFAEPPAATDPMLPADIFAGQVALVTGGGSGTGLAMAEAFARCGATVAIAGRDIDRLTQVAGRLGDEGLSALPIALDVRQPEMVRNAFERIEQTAGPVSFLANNAGANFPLLAERISPNAWHAVTRIALDGTFFCSQEFFRGLDGRPGVIVNNLASYVWLGLPGDAHSAAAKAGQMNLTLTLAAEWARHGVRVNGLVIGNYPHAGIPGFDPGTEGPRAKTIPARRPLRAQEIGRAAAFLCSPFARHITGTNLVLDGGDWLRRDVLKPEFVSPYERENLWMG